MKSVTIWSYCLPFNMIIVWRVLRLNCSDWGKSWLATCTQQKHEMVYTQAKTIHKTSFVQKKAFWSFLTALRCDALSRIWNAFGIQGDFLLCLFKNKTGQERCYCQRKGEMDTFLRICVKYKVVNLLIHTMKSFFFSWNLHEIFLLKIDISTLCKYLDKKNDPYLEVCGLAPAPPTAVYQASYCSAYILLCINFHKLKLYF